VSCVNISLKFQPISHVARRELPIILEILRLLGTDGGVLAMESTRSPKNILLRVDWTGTDALHLMAKFSEAGLVLMEEMRNSIKRTEERSRERTEERARER
jgi:hypothetical protein